MLGSSIDRQPPYAPSPYSFPTEPRSRLNINLDEVLPHYILGETQSISHSLILYLFLGNSSLLNSSRARPPRLPH